MNKRAGGRVIAAGFIAVTAALEDNDSILAFPGTIICTSAYDGSRSRAPVSYFCDVPNLRPQDPDSDTF
jgi:hypothetical protein